MSHSDKEDIIIKKSDVNNVDQVEPLSFEGNKFLFLFFLTFGQVEFLARNKSRPSLRFLR